MKSILAWAMLLLTAILSAQSPADTLYSTSEAEVSYIEGGSGLGLSATLNLGFGEVVRTGKPHRLTGEPDIWYKERGVTAQVGGFLFWSTENLISMPYSGSLFYQSKRFRERDRTGMYLFHELGVDVVVIESILNFNEDVDPLTIVIPHAMVGIGYSWDLGKGYRLRCGGRIGVSATVAVIDVNLMNVWVNTFQ